MAERLQARVPEITAAILDRLQAMEGEATIRDIEYRQGLDRAVASGVDYGLEVLALGEERASPVPLPLLTQSRLAARQRIPLDLVIRRYVAAKETLSHFMLAESGDLPLVSPAQLHHVMTVQGSVFDRILSRASEEYQREIDNRRSPRKGHNVERIQRLLRGDPADPAPLEYPLDGTHLGLVALSSDAGAPLRALSKEFDSRMLSAKPVDGATWAWVGGKNTPDPASVKQWATKHWPESVPLGIGELIDSLSGWRRTHAQAQAAAQLAHFDPSGIARYRDIALLAAASRDPLLLNSLRDMFLDRLMLDGDRGEVLRTTLFAYFAANRNSSSAASALGVTRQTVSNRLYAVEERLRQSIGACGDLLHVALQIDESGQPHP